MKELYNEYFYVPEDGKVRDKVLLTRITVSVIAILFCIVAMSITAFAYFSHGIISSSNTIQSASYDLDITPPEDIAVSADNTYVLDNTSVEDLSTMSEDELIEYYNEKKQNREVQFMTGRERMIHALKREPI